MTADMPKDRDRDPVQEGQDPAPFVVRARAASPMRNRMLALALAGFVALVFLTVLSMTILLHYAEVHHALASL